MILSKSKIAVIFPFKYNYDLTFLHWIFLYKENAFQLISVTGTLQIFLKQEKWVELLSS